MKALTTSFVLTVALLADAEVGMNTWESLPAQFNVATWFVDRNVAEGRGRSPAFRYQDRVLTYDDVLDLMNRTGNALRDLGIGMEDRVFVLCLDAPEFLGAFWGAIKIGAVPIPVNTLMRGDDYLYFLQDSRAKAAVISAPLMAEAGPVLARAPHLRHVLVAGGQAARRISRTRRAWTRPPPASRPQTPPKTTPPSGCTRRGPRGGRRAPCTCITT